MNSRSEENDVSATALAAARVIVTQSLRPTRPLPSDAVLIGSVLFGFLLLASALAWPLGFIGFLTLTVTERLLYGAVLFAGAWGLATVFVQQIIPGSRTRITTRVALFGAPILVAGVVGVLFPLFGTERFVARGVPCLLVGCTCAAISSLLLGVLVRWGFVVSREGVALVAGSLAGFSGVAVLALHCPLHSAAHIIVWHMGAIVIAAGAAYGLIRAGEWLNGDKN